MAQIYEPRVRQQSETVGTGNIVFTARQFGGNSFDDVMAPGDTCDYCISYGDTFEEGLGTFNTFLELERTTVTRARHAGGTIDTTRVSFAPGIKSVIMISAAYRFATLAGAVRFDVAQSLSAGQQRQGLTNLGLFPTNTVMFFHQTAAPLGWTKYEGYNDRALRVVSGSITVGGTNAFSTVFGQTATGATAISVAQMPLHDHFGETLAENQTHNHTVPGMVTTLSASGAIGGTGNFVTGQGNVNTGTENQTHTHFITGQGGGLGHSHPLVMSIQYVDVIVAIKD